MIQVLMSTYNGEKYLREQIESVLSQQGVDLQLLVRDDGSEDHTLEILEEYANRGQLTFYQGQNMGAAASFMDLLRRSAQADYYSFCDQDDYWKEDKLKRAVQLLDGRSQERPVVYFSRTQLTDAKLQPLEEGFDPVEANSFERALIENNVTGCTMVFNRRLRDLCNLYVPEVMLMHDSWVYTLCMAVGGSAVYDAQSSILYRQHGHNVIGAEHTAGYDLSHSGLVRRNIRSRIAGQLLEHYQTYLPPQHCCLLETISGYRTSFRKKTALLFNRQFRGSRLTRNCLLVFNLLCNRY